MIASRLTPVDPDPGARARRRAVIQGDAVRRRELQRLLPGIGVVAAAVCAASVPRLLLTRPGVTAAILAFDGILADAVSIAGSVRAADRALYAAKEAGRSRFVVAEPDAGSRQRTREHPPSPVPPADVPVGRR